MNLKGKVKQLSWKIKETIYLSKPQQNIGDFFQFFFSQRLNYIQENPIQTQENIVKKVIQNPNEF